MNYNTFPVPVGIYFYYDLVCCMDATSDDGKNHSIASNPRGNRIYNDSGLRHRPVALVRIYYLLAIQQILLKFQVSVCSIWL